MVNMVILNTIIVIYKHRHNGSIMRLIEILRFSEMQAEEYDCEILIKDGMGVGNYYA